MPKFPNYTAGFQNYSHKMTTFLSTLQRKGNSEVNNYNDAALRPIGFVWKFLPVRMEREREV